MEEVNEGAMGCSVRGLCLGLKVEQDSKLKIVKVGEPVELHCIYDDTSKPGMLWYQQRDGEGLKLMIYSATDNSKSDAMEDGFEVWEWKRPTLLNATLKLSKSQTTDSAVYFCAVSVHSCKSLRNTEHKTCSFIQHH
ncbi:TCR VDJ BV7 BJ7 [Pelobates cultripes]|nr:TCR VDJ BV7 BJ7 [Pelobates cultripes]